VAAAFQPQNFLDSKGFTRIYNMTGGFSLWTYESRKKGYGDHSGQWVTASDTNFVTINSPVTGDTSKIVIPPTAISGSDSVYIELHFASSLSPIPPDVPESDVDGLFRLTVLDPFGMSLFVDDSLTLSDTAHINFFPQYQYIENKILSNQSMTIHIPNEGWRHVSFYCDSLSFYRSEVIIRRWYNVEAFLKTGVTAYSQPENFEIQVFPNPFNNSIRIIAPPKASIFVYDLRGRLIDQIKSRLWSPGKPVVSGIYFIKIQYRNQKIIKRVVYLK